MRASVLKTLQSRGGECLDQREPIERVCRAAVLAVMGRFLNLAEELREVGPVTARSLRVSAGLRQKFKFAHLRLHLAHMFR